MIKMERDSLLADLFFTMLVNDLNRVNELRHKKIKDWKITQEGVRLTLADGTKVLLRLTEEGS